MASQRPNRPRPSAQAGPGAIDLLEESVHALRMSALGTLSYYYLGTLPFVLGLLYFWTDLSSDANAEGYVIGAAFGMTLLFWWMKALHAVFAAKLRARCSRRPAPPLTAARLLRLTLVQGILHSTGLFILPVAAVLTIPLGWVYAFYQNVTALGDGETGSVKSVAGRAMRASALWPKQNHYALLIISFMGVFVWLNLFAAVFIVPQFVRMFTGEENIFTRIGANLLNSTALAVSLCLVYLAVDPLLKAFYVLRCFYGDSLHSGEDLLSELRALPSLEPEADTPPAPGAIAPSVTAKPAPALAAPLAFILCAVLLATNFAVAAEPAAPAAKLAPPSGNLTPISIAPKALRDSAEEVLKRREFAWRAPRERAVKPHEESSITRFFREMLHWVKQTISNLFDWLERMYRKLFPARRSSGEESHSGGGMSPELLRAGLYALVAVAIGAIVFLAWRAWRGRTARKDLTGHAEPVAATPDLSDEHVLATQLPEDEWLQLARRLRESGEPRLALRALYLSILANFGARGLLAIARHKSNRDYLEELRRRARDRFGEAPGAFARNVRRFERVWYGPHPVSDELWEQFSADRLLIVEALAAAAPSSSIPPTILPVAAAAAS